MHTLPRCKRRENTIDPPAHVVMQLGAKERLAGLAKAQNRLLLSQTQERCYDYLERDEWVRILWLPDFDHAGGHLTQGFLGTSH